MIYYRLMNERPSAEYGIKQEDLTITADALIEDNRSPEAEAFRANFNAARHAGELTVVQRCSDARLKSIGKTSVSMTSIAAARIPDARLLWDRGSARGIILTHFDGDTAVPGVMPEGCGGLRAKKTETHVGGEIGPYVREVISHQDPFVQSLRAAERSAWISDKPVAAMAIDHRTDDIYTIGVFKRRGNSMSSLSAMKEAEIDRYDPSAIYAEGLPAIDEADLPEEFIALLEQNRAEQAAIMRRYPNLRELQRVQRPRMVLLSTDVRSAKKLPRTTAVPGSVFKVFVDREKLGDEARISPEALSMGLAQASYPISHAVENHGQTESPFSNTDRLIIETPDLALSRRVWEEALTKDHFRSWIRLPGNKVILLQTNAGRINDAQEYEEAA